MEARTTPLGAKKDKIGWKNWLVVWIAGMAGQLCWNVENQWYNTFVYAKISPDPKIINWMVAVSAIVSTFSTFFTGTWSDRRGKRKPFIAWGYILWGVFLIVYGLTEFIPKTGGNLVGIATAVVIADAVMSFFGSLGNDAGFNPWTTDITNERNRGQLGAVIAIQPVIATIIGSVFGGLIISRLDYIGFFLIMGGLVMAIGIYCFFGLKDAETLKPNRKGGFWRQFAETFNFKLVFKNRLFLWVLLIYAVYFTSFNMYFPHMLNYFIYAKNYNEFIAGVFMGGGLLLAAPLTVLAGKFINRGKFIPLTVFALASEIVGLLLMACVEYIPAQSVGSYAAVLSGVFFIGVGYMIIFQALTIWCKNLYPEGMRGKMEGVRLLFYVCLPFVFAPLVSNPILEKYGTVITVKYDTGTVEGRAANDILFYVAAGFALLTIIPIVFAHLELKKQQKFGPPAWFDDNGESENAEKDAERPEAEFAKTAESDAIPAEAPETESPAKTSPE